MRKHWSLDDISWERFDLSRVDPDILKTVKAASVVEHNSGDYVTYLCNVFHDDPEFQAAARQWGREEVQHGKALARWAKLADPNFDFEKSFARFVAGFRLPLHADRSVRGSPTGELIARCVVEVGTSSFYSAIRDAADEPVLKEICHRIAMDEFRHYKLFYQHLKRYREVAPLGFLRRLGVAFGRVWESGDDELAYAYYCATNETGAYDRRRCSQAYERRAGRLYRLPHIARALTMVFRAVGLRPRGRLHGLITRGAWVLLTARNRRLDRIAA